MSLDQLTLLESEAEAAPADGLPIEEELLHFNQFGTPTTLVETRADGQSGEEIVVKTYVNEFWTAKQRQANRLHEVSYRACFKPQLARFFIERLTNPGDVVCDPFMGRGTTILEAALLGRVPMGCDINPLSEILIRPRLAVPCLNDIKGRLSEFNFEYADDCPDELLVFFHPDTLREICALKSYLLRRESENELDEVDRWIRMVAVNRLTGHSKGFFSVYTLPPNQAVSIKSQQKINKGRNQIPPRRSVLELILKKSRALLSGCDASTRERLRGKLRKAKLLTGSAAKTELQSNSVALAVTSPPFLNVVDYATDNWLRCWFCGIDSESVPITILKKLEDWQAAMTEVFVELERLLRPGGHVAFEVGEVNKGTIRLEEAVIPCGMKAGLSPEFVLINDQQFTKTANCWGVDNRVKGTNTNRIVVFRKE